MNSGGRRLKQWLIEQINSNIYNGLQWEDEERTMFRIPWKHAGKQDYNQEVDASIFKAWAIFKGKFKEGDKAEPATWKTRLRCALNKSPDFEEVTDRSQLDISEPYKVYRIVPEEEQKLGKGTVTTIKETTDMDCSPDLDDIIKESSNDEYMGILRSSHSPLDERSSMPSVQEWWQQGPISAAVVHQDPGSTLNNAFSQMLISFYYGGQLMDNMLTSHPEGCRISPCLSSTPNGFLYGSDSLQNIYFPSIDGIKNERQRHVTRKLLSHLERGVLLRANREGIFIKRLCQSRVFWIGQDARYNPCKLERDAVVKIFDTARFLQALQLYQDGHYQAPEPTVTLCFGEEFNDFSSIKSKLIIVEITAWNCQQLLNAVTTRRTQCSSGNMEISDNLASDQMACIYQDLCSYPVPPRASCFRDNLQIPV
ncbi:interferon regulatory factor 8 [Danio aesculapii]|uniref:interferon regulatory factor 8 n=1 Tax=Danio aesculapii TaxID=1142201 RepID=UPI0024C082A7|nr:interferon regulatory factor 8 [Danio aesculapii]